MDLYHGSHDEPMFVDPDIAAVYDVPPDKIDEIDPEALCLVTRNLADVFPAAQRVRAAELKVGDLLFDAYGGTHEIVERSPVKRGWIDTVRADGWPHRHHAADLVTIIRPEEA